MLNSTRGWSARVDRICDELVLLSHRERLRALADAEREKQLSLAELTELRDYFRIGHDRRDIVDLVGQALGRYRALDVLAQGGSSVVYLAETAGGVPCALKVLLPEAPAELSAHFDMEAASLERIQAPGVVRLLDHGIHREPDGTSRPYLVTEVVFGATLGKYVERRKPPLEERIGLVASVAETLAIVYARHAIVHLDLKPDNIVVDGLDRQPRLVDFGIARVHGGARDPNDPVDALTPRYASPEQLFPARFGISGTHSDQYSLALVLRELLGAAPPGADERAAGNAWVTAPLSGAGLGRVGVVLARALEVDASRRYPDLTAFARALRDEAAALPERRKRSRQLGVLFGVAVAIGAFVAGAMVTRPMPAELANRAGRVEQEAKPPAAAARAFAQVARFEPSHAAALDTLGRPAALARAEREPRAAVAASARPREQDVKALGPPAKKENDAAAYCLLAELLADDPTGVEQTKNWRRRCLTADSHGEAAHERWKNEARAVLAR